MYNLNVPHFVVRVKVQKVLEQFLPSSASSTASTGQVTVNFFYIIFGDGWYRKHLQHNNNSLGDHYYYAQIPLKEVGMRCQSLGCERYRDQVEH